MSDSTLLWELPWPSSSLWREPWVEMQNSHARLYLPYESEPGSYEWGMLDFPGAYDFRYLHSFAVAVEQIDAYDRLLQLRNSASAAAVLKDVSRVARHITALHHYRLYLDDTGCFDIIATGWSYTANVPEPPARCFLAKGAAVAPGKKLRDQDR